MKYCATELAHAYTCVCVASHDRIVRRLRRWPCPLLRVSRPSLCGGPRRSLVLLRNRALVCSPETGSSLSALADR
jgi:hypothetical protein